MIRRIFISAAFVMCAIPALAQENRCDPAPYAPTVPNGKTASQAQMLAARDAVETFIKQSDQYQDCLNRDLKSRQTEAIRKNKTIDQNIVNSYKAKNDTNQREKERVGAEFNGAVHDFKEMHPSPPAATTPPSH